MLVRTFIEAEHITLFGDREARNLIQEADDVGHRLIEARVPAGSTETVEDEHRDASDVQAYYCIAGSGTLKIDNSSYNFTPGELIALASDKAVVLASNTDMRVAAIFCYTGIKHVPTTQRSLAKIHGTDRDVFWGNGQSKRMLVKRDGLGFAFCVTVGNPDTDSLLEYRNNLESCYYISGTGEYDWGSGKHPILTDKGQATVFIMNNHDTHHMRINQESVCLSIFTPPIEGNESHDFSSGRPSSY